MLQVIETVLVLGYYPATLLRGRVSSFQGLVAAQAQFCCEAVATELFSNSFQQS